MKIVIEEPLPGEEEQLILKCREITPALTQLLASLRAGQAPPAGMPLAVYDGADIHMLPPGDAYYFESVDNRVFCYARKAVYESREKLYRLEAQLQYSDFLRVSKSVLLNIRKIKKLSPAFSGRFEALLDNGEKVIISRQYVPDLKKKLGI